MAAIANFVFFGPDNDFFDNAFLSPKTGELKVKQLSASQTQIVLRQPGTGAETTVDGFGFTFDSDDNPTGGTITGMTFNQGGGTVATFSDVTWDIVAVATALLAYGMGDSTQLDALFTSQKIRADASSATVGLDFDMAFMTRKVVVTGSDFSDFVSVGKKNDRINVGDGHDSVLAGDGDDLLRGGRGRDTLVGNAGNDSLIGGNHSDVLVGGNGDDTLEGGKGNDTLHGDKGNDFFIGGKGADVFVFDPNFGIDWIDDFEVNIDKIDMSALGITYADLTILPLGVVETEIYFGSHLINLMNVTPAELDADDFIF